LISGIYKAVDGSLAQKLKFDTISNNLANINSNAFKKDIISFDKALAIKNSSTTDFTPGPLHYTGNKLDVAIDGPGFFKIQTVRGIRYTRDGSFSVNSEGLLVTHKGDAVLGQNGPISVRDGDIIIGSDGEIELDGAPTDKIILVDFAQSQNLRKEGMSYYIYEGEEKGILNSNDINIQQGYIENSNVNPTEEMIKMIETLRAFESAQKAIQTMDELNRKMVNDVGLLQ